MAVNFMKYAAERSTQLDSQMQESMAAGKEELNTVNDLKQLKAKLKQCEGTHDWPGGKQAIEDFLAKHGDDPELSDVTKNLQHLDVAFGPQPLTVSPFGMPPIVIPGMTTDPTPTRDDIDACCDSLQAAADTLNQDNQMEFLSLQQTNGRMGQTFEVASAGLKSEQEAISAIVRNFV